MVRCVACFVAGRGDCFDWDGFWPKKGTAKVIVAMKSKQRGNEGTVSSEMTEEDTGKLNALKPL